MNIDIREEKNAQNIQRQRLTRLAEDKRKILGLPPEKALDAILDHPQNTALVHSMAEEDFFFLTNDIGPHDALELLSLASNRQWEYILDIEVWNRDRINVDAVTFWLNLLHQADPNRFIQWTMQDKYDLLEYYLNQTIDILILENDDDPSDFPDGFFTYDGTFYIRFHEDAFADIEDEETREELENFVFTLLERLAAEDHTAYQLMLLRSINVMPGESEEEAFRFRNVRLAEKGFLPFDEAVGVYAPIRPESVKKRPRKILLSRLELDFNVPVPVGHSNMLSTDTLFGKALFSIDIEEILSDIQVEFAALCNQVIAADQHPIRERDALRGIVNKGCGYLSIGLHRLAGTRKPPGAIECAALLHNYSLEDIFRTGYGLVIELKTRAMKWQQESWFTRNQLALNFWDERLVGHIGGLLLKRPKCFDNYASGELYRDFATMDDIKTTEAALSEAIAFDTLFTDLQVETRNLPDRHFITSATLLLTLWANNRLDQKNAPDPIAIDKFRPFYESLWTTGKQPMQISDSTKADFLKWLSESTGKEEVELSEKFRDALERLFDRVEKEFALVSPEDLDHRFVQLFLLKK